MTVDLGYKNIKSSQFVFCVIRWSAKTTKAIIKGSGTKLPFTFQGDIAFPQVLAVKFLKEYMTAIGFQKRDSNSNTPFHMTPPDFVKLHR